MIALPVIDPNAGPRDEGVEPTIWRSLDHLKQHPDLVEQAADEFMDGASDPPSGASRRQFVQVMGASLALAGLTACRRPETRIVAHVRQPENLIPGVAQHYATAMPFRGLLRPLLVESHEGRPTKIEGNPEHPISKGATSPFEQASLLHLYDPDRSRAVWKSGTLSNWKAFASWAAGLGTGAAGRRIAVLAEPGSSPSLRRLRTQMQQRFPNLLWVTWAAEGQDNQRQGMQSAFGRPVRPLYRFSQAKVILSLDADFLSPVDRGFLPHAAEFVAARRPERATDTMSRFYAVESAWTNTGAMADHRLRLRAGDIPAFAAALAAQLGVGTGPAITPAYADFARAVINDLRAAGSGAVVLAGETQPPEVHALCMAVNAHLGSIGTAVQLLDTDEDVVPAPDAEFRRLIGRMNDGRVDTLVMIGVNPVHNAPGELRFAEALKRVRESIHFGLYRDETAQVSTWHLPSTHYLEAWGDGRAYDGTLSVIQPLIAPLYPDTHSDVELLNLLATGQETPGYDLVRATLQQGGPGLDETGWNRALHDGFVPASAYPTTTGAPSAPVIPTTSLPSQEDIELVFRLDPTVLDGSFSNISWMQELADPITKIVWDNVAVMSPRTAEKLDVTVKYHEGKHYADLIEIKRGAYRIEIPVWIVPGHPDGTIGLNMGYGRAIESTREKRSWKFFDTLHYTDVYADGALANGVGVNVAQIRPQGAFSPWSEIRKLGNRQMVASTQEHFSMEGRPIVRWSSFDRFKENAHFPQDHVQPFDDFPTLWDQANPKGEPDFRKDLYARNQWGMAIDLNSCIGCNACIVACNSENNIPNVGKDQVARGREMLWLRVDRYFIGSDEETTENPSMAFQPMMCVHCEDAPCEPVCPVAATSHSADGLNEMTYNRCIGTRYCANNCPYKVRRFNYYNWTKSLPTEVQMANNPDVTVRFRGVMEKCTYCVQRIREGQRRTSIEKREMKDGDVVTACAQVCPTQAIVFGDLTDPTSRVNRLKKSPRKYEVLEELNTKPRTSYLGLVRNTNASLVPAALAVTDQTEHE